MKDDTHMYDDFFEGLCDTREAELLGRQLEEFKTAIFNTKEDVREKIARLFPEEFKIKITFLAHSLGIGENDAVAFEKLASTLLAQLKNMETVSISLAFSPTDATMQKISDWLREASGKRFLLDISVASELVGGVVFERGGGYKDYSLKKMIEEKYGGKKLPRAT